jgi:hypothetical protein
MRRKNEDEDRDESAAARAAITLPISSRQIAESIT